MLILPATSDARGAEMRERLLRSRATRVRVHYRTRTWTDPHGRTYAVWGDNRAIDTHGDATCVARIIEVYERHVLVQPERHARPVAIHLADVVAVTSLILTTPLG